MTARKPLHILMTADAVGGVWQYAEDLSAALASKGHRITIAVLGPAPSAQQRQRIDSLNNVELLETGLVLDWLATGPDEVIHAAEGIARIAEERQVELLHCNSPALLGAAHFSLPTVTVAHGCVATWWRATRKEPLAAEFQWHRDLTERGLQAADANIAPSADFARLVQSTYALPIAPHTVHNGRHSAPPLHGRDDPAPFALTVGRLWDAAKGARIMDQAAGLLDVPFLAAGALCGPNGESFTAAHLEVLGQVGHDELAARLNQRPVFVSAAIFEPFGLAVLEAAQAGCALVLSDIGTFRELWDDCAMFVDPCDAAGLAGAVTALIQDPERRRQLGQAAADRAGRYTPAAMAARTEEIYLGLSAMREAA